jgi:hypothetical protein
MFLIQLLLPSARESSTADPRLGDTRRELVAQFGGATAYLRAPAYGEWTSPEGARESDTVVMVEVVAPCFDGEWWRPYERTLAARFDQQVVHIRAMTVDILNEAAT